MGFGDVNSLVRFRDENPGTDIKAVMMVYDRPPFAIIGRKSRGITKDVASLAGKKFGAPAADAAFAQWPIFKAVNKIDDATMKFENVGFPVREPMLAQGEVDAVFGFSMSSYINLKSRGVPAEDIVVLLDERLRRRPLRQRHPRLAEIRGGEARGREGLPARLDEGRARYREGSLRRGRCRHQAQRRRQEGGRARAAQDGARPEHAHPWPSRRTASAASTGSAFEKALDQIGLAFAYKTKPKLEDVFTEEFLPPRGAAQSELRA